MRSSIFRLALMLIYVSKHRYTFMLFVYLLSASHFELGTATFLILFSSPRCVRRKNDIVHTLWICRGHIMPWIGKLKSQCKTKEKENQTAHFGIISSFAQKWKNGGNWRSRKDKKYSFVVSPATERKYLSFVSPKIILNSKDCIKFILSGSFSIYSFIYANIEAMCDVCT